MVASVPATVASQLVDRLNSLRLEKTQNWGNSLAQVEFSLRGLKNADKAAYIAVSSMIAALKGDQDEVRAHADEMERSFFYEPTDALNVLRSLSAVRCSERTADFALKMASDVTHLPSINEIADCVLCTGNLTGTLEVLEKASELTGLPPKSFDDYETITRIREKASDAEFAGFVDNVYSVVQKLGWQTPPIVLYPPLVVHDDDCAALARIALSTEGFESVSDLEDLFMDGMLERKDALFSACTIACGVRGEE